MANVKITELTELAAIDVADNDVVPIVDVGGDTTKKITIESLKNATAASNDFVTFIRLDANINVVQDNVASLSAEDTALQARLDTNVTAFTNEDTALQARIDANALVAASNDFITFTQLNSNINVVQDNVASLSTEDTALQARLDTNVTAFTNEDTALQARIAANALVAASNDFITFTQLNSNINVVQDNVASINANVASIEDTGGHTVTFSANVIPSADGVYDLGSATNKWKDLHLTGSSIKLGGITISSLGDEGITIIGTSGEQANVVTPQLGGAANVSANIATLEANVASTDTRLGANITLLTNEDTALQARLATNVTAFTNEDTALQARLATNALVAASNDFITFTQLNANINLVQDNVASNKR
jgi:tellurite resistance protein